MRRERGLARYIAGGVAIVLAAFAAIALDCGSARAEEKKYTWAPRPYWSGPVYGTFTDAGPDSVLGPRAKIHVPIGIELTKPIGAFGWTATLAAEFEWTTKAYLGEDSDPLRDPTYNWFPHAIIRPDSAFAATTGIRWFKAGPDHSSNGQDFDASRAIDNFQLEGAGTYMLGPVRLDVYASIWWTYSYGENTEGVASVINTRSIDDLGGKLIVRGTVDVAQVAVELGAEWQRYFGYIPFPAFYNFGIFAELHNGKFEGLIDYDKDGTWLGMGIVLTPPM